MTTETFEDVVLDLAFDVGIYAYFYEGTMFFAADRVTAEMVERFRDSVQATLNTKTQVSVAGHEVAVDFI